MPTRLYGRCRKLNVKVENYSFFNFFSILTILVNNFLKLIAFSRRSIVENEIKGVLESYGREHK